MNRLRHAFHPATAALALGALMLAGCQYHVGSLMHPQINSVAVGTITNDTGEPSFAGILRGQLAEKFMQDGSVKLTDLRKADAIVEGEIVSVRTRQKARAEVRRGSVADQKNNAYQTVIYQAEDVVKYRVRVPGYKNPLLKDAEVTGTADFSRFPDMIVPRADAFRQALRDAAEQIVSGVTEAW